MSEWPQYERAEEVQHGVYIGGRGNAGVRERGTFLREGQLQLAWKGVQSETSQNPAFQLGRFGLRAK